jgi:uncharacterized protein (TIGR02246 family)
MMTTDATHQAETEIRELLERRAEATRAKDVDGATAPFAPDVLTFDVVNPLQRVGVEGVRPRTEEWFSSFLGPIGYEMRDVSVIADGDVAFAHLLYRVSGTLASGDELGMWNRATFGFRKIAGAWRIVHEHDSVPFDPATGQASTELEPS